ncbi:unnamed protein product [Amoebophrya sp. A120]|nr:unnamed protein product [Amoebophrya sp. A120]|eukprot:GSA120T00025821001.1
MKKNAGAPGNNNGAGDVDGFTIELDLPAGAFYDGRYPGVPAYRSGKYIVKSRRLRPSYVRRLNLDQFSPIRSQRVGWADAELTLPGARTSASTVPIFLKFDELDFRNVDLAKGFLHNAEKISDVCHRVALGMTSLPAFPSLEKEAGGVQGGVVEGERMRRFLRMRPVPAPTILSVIGEPGKETGCGFLTIMAKADDDELSTPKPPTAPGPRTSSVLARRSMPGHTTTTFLQRRGAGAPGAAGRPRRPANTTTTRTPASIAADFDDALQALYTDSTSTSTDFVQGLYAELVRNLRTLDRSGFLYLDLHGLNMLVHFELLEVEDPSQPPAAPPAAAPLVQQVRYEVSLVDYKTLLYMRSAQKNFGGRDDSSLAALNDHTSGGRRDSRLLHEELQFEVTRTAPTHLPAAPALQPRPQTVRSLYAVRNLPNQWGGTGAHIKNLFYHLRHSRRDPNNAGRSCTAYGDELYPWDQWAPDAVPTGPMADEPVAYDLISGIMEDIAFDLLSSGQKEEIEIAVLEEDIAAGVYQHIPADACYAAPAGGPQPREEMDRNRIRERNSCLRERTQ